MNTKPKFDPYHKWFGIPPREQPPNHYRLLRIDLFESDPDVIENAYDKEMGNLKRQEHGPHAELVEPLSRELIAARTCLLDANKKAVYDAELREERKAEDELHKVTVTPNRPDRSGRGSGRPGVPTSRLTPLHAVDRFLAKLAGDGNTWLHGFLRAAAVVIPIAVLVGVIWLVMRGTPEPSSRLTTTDPIVGTRAGQERNDNGLKMKFCWCPPGKFTMGSPTDMPGRRSDEDQTAVALTHGFWLGKHEVTRDQWVRIMGTKPWRGETFVKEGAGYPATHVTWHDAMTFCGKLTEQERRVGRLPADWQYSLPTEAQWEYACRAGSTTAFSFGDDESRLGDFAWFEKNANDAQELYAHQVGLKKPNAWGLHDIHGNVLEWCRDWYEGRIPGGPNPEVTSTSTGSNRVIRGGSWVVSAGRCRSTFRDGYEPGFRGSVLGFRVAAVPPSK